MQRSKEEPKPSDDAEAHTEKQPHPQKDATGEQQAEATKGASKANPKVIPLCHQYIVNGRCAAGVKCKRLHCDKTRDAVQKALP